MKVHGRVVKSTGSWVTVQADNSEQLWVCKVKGRFRISGIRSTSPVAVGDNVEVDLPDDSSTGMITAILPRKNQIVRKASNLSHESHVLASNIDQALLVVTLTHPETPIEFIDRFLVAAEAYRIPVWLIFNKIDLYSSFQMEQLSDFESLYRSIGLNTLRTSVILGQNISELAALLEGKVSLLSGNSGVGKSSLVNAVDSSCDLRTGHISEAHLTGKHTTTYAEMHRINRNGFVVDTPGIKGFGMVQMEREEIYHFFPEMFAVSEHCQFHNCLHLSEPRCAVRKAVEEGKIALSRYTSYLGIMEEFDEGKYRSAGY
ncbi:MAG: ribosome small subunit-dependent GTPase A [Bacteroidales bacterium]